MTPLGSLTALVHPGSFRQRLGPDRDGVEYGRGAVHDGELVVAGGKFAPLLQPREASLDDVAAAVVLDVERGRPAAAAPRRLRWPAWSAGSGMTAVTPRRRSVARVPGA